MNKSAFIIALTGPSACGKTYVTDRIVALGESLRNEGIPFYPVRFFKYVTRPYRTSELIDLKKGKSIDVESVRAIPAGKDGCDLVYRTYGEEYGLRRSDLQRLLDGNASPIVVINDVRVVEELKREFKDRVLSVFIFRELVAGLETHKSSAAARGSQSQTDAIKRFEKAVALYRVYIENIFLFDRVILNVGDAARRKNPSGKSLVEIQTENLIRGVISGKIQLAARKPKGPKLFIVSGNAASGKDELVKAVHRMGRLQTDVLVKHTTRLREVSDENEIVCKFAPQSKILAACEAQYADEMRQLESKLTFELFYAECQTELERAFVEKGVAGSDVSFEDFCGARYALRKQELMRKLKTGVERFWDLVRGEQDRLSVASPDGEGVEVTEEDYYRLREAFFEEDPRCLNLEALKLLPREEGANACRSSQSENPSFLVREGERQYVIYENNFLYGRAIDYGFEIGDVKKGWSGRDKHLVLTASLPNIFSICRSLLGPDKVITAFTYSQISRDEHLMHSDRIMGRAKIREYEDILRYAENITEFDYALIYAETSLTTEAGNQKSELVDQLFRLFRAYNA